MSAQYIFFSYKTGGPFPYLCFQLEFIYYPPWLPRIHIHHTVNQLYVAVAVNVNVWKPNNSCTETVLLYIKCEKEQKSWNAPRSKPQK